MNIEIIKANYQNPKHDKEIAFLMNSYASDPMGGGKPLSDEVKNNLAKELSKWCGLNIMLLFQLKCIVINNVIDNPK